MPKKRLRRGLFITFEGPEGCGKSTYARMLAEDLKDKKYDCVFTREPGGTLVGEKIRAILLDPRQRNISDITETMLFETSRSQIVDEVIVPALKRKEIVLCDRFNDSTLVYQGYAGKVPLKNIRAIDSIVTRGIKPDMTVVLDIDARTGLKRAGRNKDKDRMELRALLFHKRVRKGFLKIARENKKRVKLVKVTGTISETYKKVLLKVMPLIQHAESKKKKD